MLSEKADKRVSNDNIILHSHHIGSAILNFLFFERLKERNEKNPISVDFCFAFGDCCLILLSVIVFSLLEYSRSMIPLGPVKAPDTCNKKRGENEGKDRQRRYI